MTTPALCNTPDTAIDAVIFDLDGVLADTEPVHLEAARRALAPATLPLESYVRFMGGGTEQFGAWIEQTYGIPDERFFERYTAAFIDLLQAGPSPMMVGADALVRAVLRRDLRVAVASMSRAAWVEATLAAIGLRELFPLVVTVEQVGQPKPDPEVYLQAASLLGVRPENCLAIEDSIPGVAAAAAAGMLVVQIRQADISAAPQPGAHAVIESLRDFDLRWLEGRRPGARAS